MNVSVPAMPTNLLLASLPYEEMARLRHVSSHVFLEPRRLIHEPGDEIEHVYFPASGVISLLTIMSDGKAIETASIGRDGAFGAMAAFGPYVMPTRAIAQVRTSATRIAAVALRKEVSVSPALRDRLLRHQDALLGQVQITAACNALHPLRARLASWILRIHGRELDGVIPFTQERLSEVLGVRRGSVSEVAASLRRAGLIRYTRGQIEILDRAGLEAVSCECYAALRERARLVAPGVRSGD